jgi:hypothetical protein
MPHLSQVGMRQAPKARRIESTAVSRSRQMKIMSQQNPAPAEHIEGGPPTPTIGDESAIKPLVITPT